MGDPIKYIAYCRRSSEDNREKQALSIPSQIDEIKKRFSDLNIVQWIEESHSAFDTGRPKFNQMMADLEAEEADGVLSWHPDRLARNAVDGGTIIHSLTKNVIKDIKFCSYNFLNGPEGLKFLGNMFTDSKYFSDKLSIDVKRGQAKKLKNGQWPGLAPVGYLNTYDKPKGENSIIDDPDRFDMVRKMWDLLLSGAYSVKKIMRIANDDWKFRTIKRKKIGGRPIGLTTLFDMFSNPFYCGIIRRKGVYYTEDIDHPAMITKEEFDEAQVILGRKGKPRPKSHDFDFTGFMKCGECGGSITAEGKTKILKDGSPKHYTYYHCSHRKKDTKCNQKSLDGTYVENYILDKLNKIEINDDFVNYAKQYLKELNEQEIKDRGQVYENTEKIYADTQKRLDRLTQAYLRELIDDEQFKRQQVQLTAEKNKFKSDLDHVDERANLWLKLSIEAFDFARYAVYWFKEGDSDRRKEIVNRLGSNFVLKDKIISFELDNVFNIILKGKEKIKMEVARFEPEISNSHSYKLSIKDQLIPLWRDRPDSNRRPPQ